MNNMVRAQVVGHDCRTSNSSVLWPTILRFRAQKIPFWPIYEPRPIGYRLPSLNSHWEMDALSWEYHARSLTWAWKSILIETTSLSLYPSKLLLHGSLEVFMFFESFFGKLIDTLSGRSSTPWHRQSKKRKKYTLQRDRIFCKCEGPTFEHVAFLFNCTSKWWD